MSFWRRIRQRPGQNNGGGNKPHQSAASQQTVTPFNAHLRKVIDELNNSIVPADVRLGSIRDAHNEFDHAAKHRHDEELAHGAADALYSKLAFAAACDCTDKEVRLLCSSLEMVHRATPGAVRTCFDEVGFEALPIIVRVLQIPFAKGLEQIPTTQEDGDNLDNVNRGSGNVEGRTDDGGLMDHSANDDDDASQKGKSRCCASLLSAHREKAVQRSGSSSSNDIKTAVQKLTKVVACYSLLPGASKVVVAESPGMLEALVRIMDRQCGMTEAARYSALAALANLSQSDENHITMASTAGLVDGIARMARPEESDVARQCAALALMHLSYGNRDNVPLAENATLIDTFVELLRDANPDTRKNSAIGLYNFACADENAVKLVNHRGGVVLEVLVLILSNHTDMDESRVLAVETLSNLSQSENVEVTDKMGRHPGLLVALGSVLKFRDGPLRVQEVAAETLLRFAHVTFSSMPSHDVLLTALVQASSWTKTSRIAEAYDVQALIQDHRPIMAEHLGLLNGLATQALAVGEGSEAVREAAISAIQQLTTVEGNRKIMSENEGIMMALTRASFEDGGGDADGSRASDKDGVSTGGEGFANGAGAALKSLTEVR